MLAPNMDVTIEPSSGLEKQVGKTATVIKVVRCFAVLLVDGEVHSCPTDGVQPKVTFEQLRARHIAQNL
jgi:hypothetical protein